VPLIDHWICQLCLVTSELHPMHSNLVIIPRHGISMRHSPCIKSFSVFTCFRRTFDILACPSYDPGNIFNLLYSKNVWVQLLSALLHGVFKICTGSRDSSLFVYITSLYTTHVLHFQENICLPPLFRMPPTWVFIIAHVHASLHPRPAPCHPQLFRIPLHPPHPLCYRTRLWFIIFGSSHRFQLVEHWEWMYPLTQTQSHGPQRWQPGICCISSRSQTCCQRINDT
jgi:hypothetical protein